MSRLSILLFALLMLFTAGCAQNYYNIPRDTYAKKVRNLGVAPLFVDADSDIRHPEKGQIVALLHDLNRKNEPELVAALKDTGSYLSVTLLPDDSDRLFSTLLFRREKRDDAGIVYNKYFYKTPELKELITRNNLDALLLLVVSGLSVNDTIYSSTLLEKLESEYNFLSVSAQIVDAEGTVLWEFPNFRKQFLSYPKLMVLQYPDFDEARANETDKVEVKFKTVPGIMRYLNRSSTSSYRKNARVSDKYSAMFEEMATLLRPQNDLFGSSDKPQSQSPQPVTSPATAADPVPQLAVPAASPSSPPTGAPSPAPAATPPPAPSIPVPAGSPAGESISSPVVAPAN